VLGALRLTARYRAPAADGGVLAEPPFAEIGAQFEENHRRLATAARPAGVPLSEFRAAAAAEVLNAAQEYSGEPFPISGTGLLMAGHQPELFHPGVWAKNFALYNLGRTHGLVPLNLVVDNDTPRASSLKVPVSANDPDRVTAVTVPFDSAEGDAPYEETYVASREMFASFAGRVRAHTSAWGYEPFLDHVWPCVVGAVEGGATLGEAFVRMRRCVERAWGVANLELPVSRLAETRAFAGFVATILPDLPRFSDAYNRAIREYRRANHLHSRNHPAPELTLDGDWIEAPLWVWRSGSGRRERLFARRGEGTIDLRAGRRDIGQLPADPAGLMERWPQLPGEGWKVRPRALSLTLFVRLCLADGFIHGIGGGKYDEVTDAIIRDYFGITPPGFAVVTATLRLPIPTFPTTAEDVKRTERAVRDLEWKPETTDVVRSRAPDAVARKGMLIASEPAERTARRKWFRGLQEVTRSMRPVVADELAVTEARLGRMRRELVANDILRSREYSWVLFPEALLKDRLLRLG
jgi:hypothetical protein